MQAFIEHLSKILEQRYILTQDEDKAPYLTDWRKRYIGKALAVLLPSTSDEVAAIVKLCV